MYNINNENFNAPENGGSGATKYIFNNGKAGVVPGCTVKVTKKDSKEVSTAPNYKLEGLDEAQQKALANGEENIYPVNKGFWYKDSYNSDSSNKFSSEKAESYAVNELKHLLKTFGHPHEYIEGNLNIKIDAELKCFNDFLDYVMDFIQKSDNNTKYDLVVDYGNENYPKSFLQLNGMPWYIKASSDDKTELQTKINALLERPKPDSKDDNVDTGGTTVGATNDLPW